MGAVLLFDIGPDPDFFRPDLPPIAQEVGGTGFDQSFIRHLTDSSSDQKIVRAIVSMAADLELSVVTEGVETPEQKELLRQMGCRLLQGYLFGRPQPAHSWLGEKGLDQEAFQPFPAA